MPAVMSSLPPKAQDKLSLDWFSVRNFATAIRKATNTAFGSNPGHQGGLSTGNDISYETRRLRKGSVQNRERGRRKKESTGKQLVRRSRVRVHDACKRGKQTRMVEVLSGCGRGRRRRSRKTVPVMLPVTLRNLSSIVGVKRNHLMATLFSPPHLNLSLYVTRQSECAYVHMREPHYTAQAGLKTAVSLGWPWTHPVMASHFATCLTHWMIFWQNDSICISERSLGSIFQSGVDRGRTNRKIYPPQ